MFVYLEVQQQRAKSNCDGGDDDHVQSYREMFNKGQLSPVPFKIKMPINLHFQITNDDDDDDDDEESCCIKTSHIVVRPFPHTASLPCVSELRDGEEYSAAF